MGLLPPPAPPLNFAASAWRCRAATMVLELRLMNREVSVRPSLLYKVWYLFSPQLWVSPLASNKWFCSLKRGGVEVAVSCLPEVLVSLAEALGSSPSGQSRAQALSAFSQAKEPEGPWDGVGMMRQRRAGHRCKKLMSES